MKRTLLPMLGQYLLPIVLLLLFPFSVFCQWTNVNVGTTDDLNAIDFEGNTIFMGGFRLVKSVDGGASWNTYPLLDDLSTTIFGSELYDVHFFDQDTGVATGFILTGNSEVILRTVNGGLNWSFVNVNNGGAWPRLLNDIDFPTSTTGYAVGSNGRILKSNDMGQSWSALASGTTRELSAVHFMSSTTGIIVGDGLILKTVNGGGTWVMTNYPGNSLTDIHFINANVGVVNGSGGLLKTTDGGDSWTPISGSVGDGPVYMASVDTLFLGGSGIFKSVNGGDYFLPQPSGGGVINELDFFNGNVGYAVGEDGLVKRTTSFGDPFPLNDAGIGEIEPFPSNPCPDVFPVGIRLNNRGLYNLTSATIHWEVNGQLQTPYAWSGNLAAAESSDFIAIGSYSFPLGDNPIKVWTSDPNASPDDFTGNDTLTTVFSLNRLFGTYTIGGVNPDFTTISDAVAATWYPGVCGQVVFNIRSGTYTGEISIKETLFPPADDYEIVFQSESGNPEDVTLTAFPNTTTYAPTLLLDGAKHTTIQNLTIKSDGTTFNRALGIRNGASDLKIRNNVLEGKETDWTTSDYVVAYSNGQSCNNLDFSENRIKYGSTGIVLSELYASPLGTGNTIRDNIFEDQSIGAISCVRQLGVEVTGNTVTSNSANSTMKGIALTLCSDTFQVAKNKISLTAGSGLFFSNCNIQSEGKGWVTNNFIQSGALNYLAKGISIEQSHHLNIYNNSISIQSGPGPVVSMYITDTSFVNTYVNVKNNIFSNAGTGGIYSVFHSIFNVSIKKVFNLIDNNAYYTSGSLVSSADVIETYNYSHYITSLELWKILLNKDYNSFLADPQFQDDLHIFPQSSNYLLSGAAIPIPEISDDIDGEMRDASSPDIGADEFEHPGLDAGIAGILNASQYCSGNSPVLVALTNYGTDTLYQIVLRWSVNNIEQPPFQWNGVLATGGQSALLEIGAYDFFPGNNYLLNVWTDAPNGEMDNNTVNDGTSVNVTGGGMSGVYTVGGESPDFQTFNAVQQALVSNGVCGAVTFKVRPGIYFEQVSFPEIAGASETNTITFESENGYYLSVELTYSANSANDFILPTLEMDGADYFIFKNMTFSGGVNTQDFNQIILWFKNGCHHNQFIGNHFKGLDFPSNYNRLTLVYSDDNSLDEYNLFEGNRFTDGTNAISIRSNNNINEQSIRHARGNRFINNVFIDAKVKNLALGYQQDLVVEKNVLELNPAIWANYQQGGILIGGIGKVRVVGNQVTGMGGPGISVANWSSPVERGLIANNFVSVGNFVGSPITAALRLSLTGGNDVLFNNLMIFGQNAGTRTLDLSYQPCSSIRIKNNNIINTTPMGQAVNGYFNNDFESDYNNLFTAGGAIALPYADLAALQSALGLDLHSRSVDPHFVSFSDLHLNDSNMLQGTGIPVSGILLDIDGEVRDPIAPYIGADEFSVRSFPSLGALSFTSGDPLANWEVPVFCNNELPVLLPCDSTGNTVFHLEGNLLCTGDDCLNSEVKWFIFDGINLIAEGISSVSFNPGQPAQFFIPNPYSLFTPNVVYTLTLQYDCGACSLCECSVKFLVDNCGPCTCLGFYDMQFGIDGGAFIPAQCDQGVPVELTCPTDGGVSFFMEGSLHCTDTCATNVEWEIQNSFNTILYAGSAPLIWLGGTENQFTLPALAFSSLLAPGLYKLILRGNCGESSCACTVNFYISICDVCTCPLLTEMKFIQEENVIPAECNNQALVELICPVSTGTFSFEGEVLCSDSCGATVNFEILSFNDQLLFSGSASISPLGGNLYHFSLPNIPYNLLPTFAYNKLVIGAYCGGKICSYCIINFAMPECDFCCLYFDDFSQNVENETTVTVNNVGCNATLNIGTLSNCNDYIGAVDWGDGTVSTGPFTSGEMPNHTYTASGDYIISYTAYELDDNEEVCFEKELNDNISINCEPCDAEAFELGLTGYFPFEGDAGDLSPTALDGVVSGATLVTGHDGVSNSAYYFNGSSNKIECGTNNRGVSDEVSVCAWVKTNEIAKGQWVAGKFLGFLGAGENGYHLTIGNEYNQGIGMAAFGGRDGSALQYSSGFSSTSVNDGEWHCLVGVAGSQSWKIYVDGLLENSSPGGTSNLTTPTSEPLTIGWHTHPTYPLWMNGGIDDVRIYNRALTEHEVECFCSGDLPTIDRDLVHSGEILLFPNPTSGGLTLEFEGATPNVGSVQILDLYGRMVEQEKLLPGEQRHNLSITALPAGVYFLRVLDDGVPVWTEKVVKQ